MAAASPCSRNLDFSTDACPGEWLLDGSKPYCRRDSEVASAASASFPSFGVPWTELHTTLTAYQYASMNAFYYAEGRGLDDLYVDGLSITRGAEGSREHLYTFAIGMTTKGLKRLRLPRPRRQPAAGLRRGGLRLRLGEHHLRLDLRLVLKPGVQRLVYLEHGERHHHRRRRAAPHGG
jgi:hypothetical protein